MTEGDDASVDRDAFAHSLGELRRSPLPRAEEIPQHESNEPRSRNHYNNLSCIEPHTFAA